MCRTKEGQGSLGGNQVSRNEKGKGTEEVAKRAEGGGAATREAQTRKNIPTNESTNEQPISEQEGMGKLNRRATPDITESKEANRKHRTG